MTDLAALRDRIAGATTAAIIYKESSPIMSRAARDYAEDVGALLDELESRRTERDALCLPKGFDYVELGALLNLIEELVAHIPAYSLHAQEGDNEVCDTARQVLTRWHAALGEAIA